MTWHLAVYDVLVQSAVSGLLMLTVAGAAVLIVRQPARRVRIIEWTLAALVLAPFLSLLPGYPRWSMLPDWRPAQVAATSTEAPAKRGITYAEAVEDTSEVAVPISRESDAERSTGAVATPPLGETTSNAVVAQPTSHGEATSKAIAIPAPGRSFEAWIQKLPARVGGYRGWIVLGYVVCVAAMAAWSGLGLIALRRLLRSSAPADAKCRGLLREIAGPASDRVALLVSARVGQPCAFAWRPTTIVLPAALAESAELQPLRWALAHEWSHVARGDVWTWTASSLVRWFYFYQPLVWWLRRQLQLSQDFVADARAARLGSGSEDYAEFLTSNAARFSRLAVGLGIGGRTSDLHRRVVMLVENTRPLEDASPRRWNLAVLPIALGLMFVAASLSGQGPNQPAPADTAKADKATAEQPAKKGKKKLSLVTTYESEEESAPAKDEVRRIKPGDVLTIDVMAPAELGVLVRPDVKYIVNPQGRISLGSAYGQLKVGGRTTDEVEKEVTERIYFNRINRLSERKRSGEEGVANLSLADLNVRVEIRDESRQSQTITSATSAPTVSPYVGQLIEGRGMNSEAGMTGNVTITAGAPRRIAPGDQLHIEAVGQSDAPPILQQPAVDVEPDGTIALGARFGRLKVDGKTLSEADATLKEYLQQYVVEPEVQVTFRRPSRATAPLGVFPARPSEAEPTPDDAAEASTEILQPLDTVEIVLSLKPRVYRELVMQPRGEYYSGKMPEFSGTYIIEPDGEIALPHGFGRVNVEGMDAKEAGAAIRARLVEKQLTRTALPAVRVIKRGHAVFPEANTPTSGYRIRNKDKVLMGDNSQVVFNVEVDADGTVAAYNRTPEKKRVRIEGLTLAEAHEAIQKESVQPALDGGGGIAPTNPPLVPVPVYVTIGGWTEDADSQVIEQLEGGERGRVLGLEEELDEMKAKIRDMQRFRGNGGMGGGMF